MFLSVFKWEARKAPETLLRAYLREFSALDDVALALRCELYHEDRDVTRERVLELAREAYEEGVWSSIPGADESKDFETASRRVAPRVVVLPGAEADESHPRTPPPTCSSSRPGARDGGGRTSRLRLWPLRDRHELERTHGVHDGGELVPAADCAEAVAAPARALFQTTGGQNQTPRAARPRRAASDRKRRGRGAVARRDVAVWLAGEAVAKIVGTRRRIEFSWTERRRKGERRRRRTVTGRR